MLFEFNTLETVPHLLVGVVLEGVNIFSYRSLNQEGCLRDVRNTLPEQVEAHLSNVFTINEHLSILISVSESKEDLQDRAFA